MKLTDIADRAAAYGFPGVVVDGNDVLAVREAAAEAVERARSGGGPTLIECKTWRHWGHFIGDMATYRDPAEHEAWLKRDPIPAFGGSAARAREWRPKPSSRQSKQEADAEMEAAVEFAEEQPFPTRRRLTTDVYARRDGR